MFAKIDSEFFDVFLSPDEIDSVQKKPLKGKIITPEKTKADLDISVNMEKSGKYGINVEEKRGDYSVFVSPEYWKELKESGYVGARYDTLGLHKANLMDETRIDDEKRMDMKWLKKFYE